MACQNNEEEATGTYNRRLIGCLEAQSHFWHTLSWQKSCCTVQFADDRVFGRIFDTICLLLRGNLEPPIFMVSGFEFI
jgi:hypothetical protein